MKHFVAILCALNVLGGSSPAAQTATPLATREVIFGEADGLIAVEAEHFYKQTLTDKRAWHITSPKRTPTVKPDADAAHLAGASGGAYVEALPDTRTTHDDKLIKGENFTDKPGELAMLHYQIHVATPGRYFVWARVFSTGTEDNGFHVGLDGAWPLSGQRWQTTQKNKWAWDCRQRTPEVHVGVPMQLWIDIETPGAHELTVSMREDGFELDKLVLARSADFKPEGDGPAVKVHSGTAPAPFAAVAAAAAVEKKTTLQPNILIILSDDVGYSDLGCHGGEIATPNLDALATGGLRFTQFYNTARCCPTRASLLTGLHPHQAGVGHMMDDRGHDGYRGTLNRRCVTIAEALQPAGYRSYAAGKWHVTPGQSAQALAVTNNWPLQRGFDRFYGTIHGAGSYFDPSSLVRDNRLITVANDQEYRPAQYYYTDAIADHAVKFIREHMRDHRTRPFFLYASFTAAHWPLHAKDADIAKYKGRYATGYEAIRAARRAKLKQLGLLDDRWTPHPPAEKWDDVKDKAFEARCMEVYAAQLDSMDQGIGRVIAELKAQGKFENTLIFYLQDNGGCAEMNGRGQNATERAEKPSLPPMTPDDPQFNSQPKQTRDGWPVRQGLGVMPGGPDTYIAYGRGWAHVSNTPFREYKHWTHEGGISTPLIVHWPAGMRGGAKPGGLVREPGQLVDLMATCIDVAGAKYPKAFRDEAIHPMEGTSLKPAFTGKKLGRTKPLVWEHEGNRAIRDGPWKLVAKENQPWELYDLDADRAEQHNLAASEPARVKVMTAAWDAWAARANVLPLGTWRGKAAAVTNASTRTRFVLKAGDKLERGEVPAIARRGFTVTATFRAEPADRGVLVAQGGSSIGYALYVADGRLHFIARDRSGHGTVSVPLPPAAAHTATARLTSDGTLTLRCEEQRPAKSSRVVPITAMPADGLDVGADEGGAVGPYSAPNRFTGTIESVLIELDTQ